MPKTNFFNVETETKYQFNLVNQVFCYHQKKIIQKKNIPLEIDVTLFKLTVFIQTDSKSKMQQQMNKIKKKRNKISTNYQLLKRQTNSLI